MFYLFYVLLYGYGGLMSVAAIISFKEQQTPFWAMVLTLIGATFLFFTPKSDIFFYIGLLSLLISALVNGTIINGAPNIIHVIVRILFSFGLILLYRKM